MTPQRGDGQAYIQVIGSCNMDLVTVTPRVPGSGETINATSFTTGFGGKGANQAVSAARLLRLGPDDEPDPAISVSMVGAVGDDQFGADFITHLRDVEKIDINGVRGRLGSKTGTSVILVEEDSGQNRILFTKGANGLLTADEAVGRLEQTRQGGKHFVILQMEIPVEVTIASIQAAKAKSEVIFNPAPAVTMPDSIYDGLDHLIMNESEAAILSGIPEAQVKASLERTTDAFLAKGVRNVVITLGSEGAYFRSSTGDASGGSIAPGLKVKAVDTTAAGDTFVGAYAVHLARNGSDDIAGAVRYGNLAASVAVTKPGAQMSMPYQGDL